MRWLAQARLRQHGAATLVVVMMLFLIMALLAAYAHRSVLFEQRMSVSYVRASLAQEAAESGIEWTLAQLNGTSVDASCKPVASGGRRFADRYLLIDPANRILNATGSDQNGVVDCARDSSNNTWACRCPNAADARVPSSSMAGQPAMSFVTHLGDGPRPGTLKLNVVGCSDSVVDKCLGSFTDASRQLLGKALASTLVGFVSAVRSPPAAPLVVNGNLTTTGPEGLGLHNADPVSGGVLAMIGGEWPQTDSRRLDTMPGSTLDAAISKRDPLLQHSDAHEFFKKFMGVSVSRYRSHPSLRVITCNGECSDAIDTAYKAGKRMMWVQGPLVIDSNREFGSVNDPIVLVSTGDATLSGAFRFTGLLVSQGNVAWTNDTGIRAMLTGSLLVAGSMTTTGAMDIVYQQAVSNQLRNRVGSYVRVPGSWIDLANI